MIKTHFRSIFISDVHLGTSVCQAAHLYDFLQTHHSDYLYLVGDIIDLQRMQYSVSLSNLQQKIVELVVERATQGTKVIYIPGNHDRWLRKFCGEKILGVYFARHKVHTTADGRQLFVSHGDELEQHFDYNPLLQKLGDWANTGLMTLNFCLNQFRLRLGLGYWSASRSLKKRLSFVRHYVQKFEASAFYALQRTQYDGYVCGHIHFANLRTNADGLYCNLGDWVETCSALTENHRGELELIQWHRLPEDAAKAAVIILASQGK